MRRYVQPFREERIVTRCKSCGDAIHAGDLAYGIDGESYCPLCIEESAYIAGGDEETDSADYFERTNVYLSNIAR